MSKSTKIIKYEDIIFLHNLRKLPHISNDVLIKLIDKLRLLHSHEEYHDLFVLLYIQYGNFIHNTFLNKDEGYVKEKVFSFLKEILSEELIISDYFYIEGIVYCLIRFIFYGSANEGMLNEAICLLKNISASCVDLRLLRVLVGCLISFSQSQEIRSLIKELISILISTQIVAFEAEEDTLKEITLCLNSYISDNKQENSFIRELLSQIELKIN